MEDPKIRFILGLADTFSDDNDCITISSRQLKAIRNHIKKLEKSVKLNQVEWLKELPTESGFYFVERVGSLSGNTYLSICKISYINEQLFAYCKGDLFSVTDETFIRFSTKLEPPK